LESTYSQTSKLPQSESEQQVAAQYVTTVNVVHAFDAQLPSLLHDDPD